MSIRDDFMKKALDFKIEKELKGTLARVGVLKIGRASCRERV